MIHSNGTNNRMVKGALRIFREPFYAFVASVRFISALFSVCTILVRWRLSAYASPRSVVSFARLAHVFAGMHRASSK